MSAATAPRPDPAGGTAPSLRAVEALTARLRSAAGVLLPAAPPPSADGSELLSLVVAAVAREPSGARVWLLLAALAGRFPDERAVADAARVLHDSQTDPGTTEAVVWLLSWALRAATPADAGRELRLLRGVAVDVGPAGLPGATRDLPGVTRVAWWPGDAGLCPADGSHQDADVLLAPWGCAVVAPDPDGADGATRRARETALAPSPAAAVGYRAGATGVRLRPAGPRDGSGATGGAATGERRTPGGRETALEEWLADALPVSAPLGGRVLSYARGRLAARPADDPVRRLAVRVRAGLRS